MTRTPRERNMEIERLLVKDIMSSTPVTVRKDETVKDVMAKMKAHKVREVPVLDGTTPVGLVSYRSFLERRSVPLTAKVGSIMIPCPRLEEDMKVADATEALVSAGIRGAPVVRNGKVVGFLSRTDIIRTLPKIDQLMGKQVGSFMTANPRTVSGDDTVQKAQIIMDELNEKALPVVDGEGRLVGVVGMKEVIDVIWRPKTQAPPRSPKPPRKVFDSRVPAETPIKSVMNSSPVSVSPADTLEKTAKAMLDKGISTLFVTEDGKLVGVVDQADLMEEVISLRPKEGVYIQISGLGLKEPDVYDALYDVIGRGLRRIDRIVDPRVFTIHIGAYHRDGLRSKYTLGARLTTQNKMYYARASDWDLFKAVDSVIEVLERSIKRDRDKRLDMKKRRLAA